MERLCVLSSLMEQIGFTDDKITPKTHELYQTILTYLKIDNSKNKDEGNCICIGKRKGKDKGKDKDKDEDDDEIKFAKMKTCHDVFYYLAGYISVEIGDILYDNQDAFKKDLSLAKEAYNFINDKFLIYECFRIGLIYAILPDFDQLSHVLEQFKGKKILSIASGSGYLEYWMSIIGLNVICTDSNESFNNLTTCNKIKDINAENAIKKYIDKIDIIFASWLPADFHYDEEKDGNCIRFDEDPGAQIIDFLENANTYPLLMLYESISDITETGTSYFWDKYNKLKSTEDTLIKSGKDVTFQPDDIIHIENILIYAKF